MGSARPSRRPSRRSPAEAHRRRRYTRWMRPASDTRSTRATTWPMSRRRTGNRRRPRVPGLSDRASAMSLAILRPPRSTETTVPPRPNDSVTLPRFVTASSRKRPRPTLVRAHASEHEPADDPARGTDDDHDAHAHADGKALPDPPPRREEDERIVVSGLRAAPELSRRSTRSATCPGRSRGFADGMQARRRPSGVRRPVRRLSGDRADRARTRPGERRGSRCSLPEFVTRTDARPDPASSTMRRGGGERHRRPCSARAGRGGREQKQGSQTGAAQGGSDHRPTTV